MDLLKKALLVMQRLLIHLICYVYLTADFWLLHPSQS